MCRVFHWLNPVLNLKTENIGKNREMRIVLLNDAFLHYGLHLANALAKAGHNLLFVAPEGTWEAACGMPNSDYQFREVLDSSVSLEWVKRPLDTTLFTIGANLNCIFDMVSIIRRFKPDVLHMHDMAECRYLVVAALVRHLCPIVLTVHNAEPHIGKKDNRMEFTRPWLRRMADAVIVHGCQIKQRFLEVSGFSQDRVFIIPHGPFAYYRKWLKGSQCDGRKVLFFGGVFRYKGLDYLIEAARIVCREIPDAKFIIAGAGPYWTRCRELIGNSESFILQEGRIPDPDVVRLFEESAIVVLPYIEASQSGVLALASALERPSIVTNVGSLPEAVNDGVTGLIVPPADSEALARAILRLLSDSDFRIALGKAAYRKMTTGEFCWENIAAKTQDVYRLAIASRLKQPIMEDSQ